MYRAFANALEVVPATLAENAGLNPISTVTELRNRHAEGETTAGINVRKGAITNILEENVVQPLLVTSSIINFATETVRSILKIDDIVSFDFLSSYPFIPQLGYPHFGSSLCLRLTLCSDVHLRSFLQTSNMYDTNLLMCEDVRENKVYNLVFYVTGTTYSLFMLFISSC